jgi:ABC-type dipeptide/oligopeptide/nickel transport system permease subunit
MSRSTFIHMLARLLDFFETRRDAFWTLLWVSAMASLFLWDANFLNAPAFSQLRMALLNTLLGAFLVVAFAGVMGWTVGVGRHFLSVSRFQWGYRSVDFLLSVVRSVPQIIGVLIGYVIITRFIQSEALVDPYLIILWTSFVVSLFVFLEVADLIQERIAYFVQLDFVNAMLVCGIPERRIINREILWKNSISHLIHKCIAVFGMAIFLQCSIDFIVSVGLSRDVSASNFPTTLGSMLAKLDSKQDILAIGRAFSDPSRMGDLLLNHLQGTSTAFAIVFTLLCVYQIGNGYVHRHKL